MTMNYRLLGRSGLRVSELSLGTMTFGDDWGWGASAEDSKKQLDAYVEAGGNFIDMANLYTNGSSEKIVGELVRSERERFVIATKYTLLQRPGDPNGAGGHRKSLVHALEASLRRLGTDHVDLYYVHADDGLTPIDEIMRALDDQVRLGKVLHVGVSDWPAWKVARANTMADLRGWTPFVGLQIEYSLIERTVERELLPMAEALDLGVLAWGPLGGGVLTGKYRASGEADDSKRTGSNEHRVTDRNLRIADEVVAVAKEVGRPPSQVAINWVRQRPGVVIPILGARTPAQLADNLAALEFELDDAHLRRLDDVSRVDLGFPTEFLTRDRVRKLVQSDVHERIRPHRTAG